MNDALLRSALLSLHGTLVDFERRAYEKANGRVANAEFLQLLVRDPALAWLAPLTSLIARFDELGGEKDSAAQRRTWRARVRALIGAGARGEFARQYARRIEASPDVAFAHAAALHTLKNPG